MDKEVLVTPDDRLEDSREQQDAEAVPSEEGRRYDDYAEADEGQLPVSEFDLTATPNDFNVKTLNDFTESGVLTIPGFQRNYVWDIKRASRLVESLILGLPVPQVFLYEERRNRFIVIDGQQRLMSIYYFMKRRFPKREKRGELRAIFDEHHSIPDAVLDDDRYFTKFNLVLPEKLPNHPNRLRGLNYGTLGDFRAAFDLRPLRSVVVRSNAAEGRDEAMYEIFYRLNSGGMNITPQEIRMCLYHSNFFVALGTMNRRPGWRRLLGSQEPDVHLKDVEVLLRGFAMLARSQAYAPSLTKFLNGFAEAARGFTQTDIEYVVRLFDSFIAACEKLPADAFQKKGRLNLALFEAVFAAACREAYLQRTLVERPISHGDIVTLAKDPEFTAASDKATTDTKNVRKRLERAQLLIEPH